MTISLDTSIKKLVRLTAQTLRGRSEIVARFLFSVTESVMAW